MTSIKRGFWVGRETGIFAGTSERGDQEQAAYITRPMKFTILIPPAVALILVGTWIFPQRFSMVAVEAECARLRSTITAVGSPSTTRPDPLAKRRKIIEWTKLGTQFQSNPMMSSISFSGALPDQRVAMRFRQRMAAMSAAEIIVAIDEIAALDLPPKVRENLEWTLLDSMARKDPAAALGLLESRGMIKSSLYQYLISGALAAWAHKDPAAAGGWFDEQIAAGTFDSKALNGVSDSRHSLESAFIRILLGSSPEAAARRLAALPEDQRGDVMHTYDMSSVPEEIHVAHAALIRARVPEKDQAETIASQITNLVKCGDYSAATAYLARITATPAERAASVMKVTRDMVPKNPYSDKLTREDFNALREWAGSQSPESVDKVTAKALGDAAEGNRNIEFSTAADLAVEYSAQSGNDEVLAVFLTSHAARRNKAVARDLAAKIADGTRRAEILDFLK
jgi:hypothetical protein